MNFLLFYRSAVLSSHPEDGHQMYFGGSVVGKASTIGIGISPTPPLIFTGGQKVRRLKRHSTLSRPHLKMQQDIRILEQKCNAWMIALCRPNVVKLGPRTPEKALSVLTHHLTLHAKTR